MSKVALIAGTDIPCWNSMAINTKIGVEVYKRLAAAGDIKAAQKLAALTGQGDLAAKGASSVDHYEIRYIEKFVCHNHSIDFIIEKDTDGLHHQSSLHCA